MMKTQRVFAAGVVEATRIGAIWAGDGSRWSTPFFSRVGSASAFVTTRLGAVPLMSDSDWLATYSRPATPAHLSRLYRLWIVRRLPQSIEKLCPICPFTVETIQRKLKHSRIASSDPIDVASHVDELIFFATR